MPTPLVPPDAIRLADALLAVARREPVSRLTPPHAHLAGQLLGSHDGLLSVTTEAGDAVLPSTHAVWVPPGAVHAMRSHGPFRGWSVYVAAAGCAALPQAPRTLRVGPLLRAAIDRAAGWDRPPESPPELRLAAVILDEIAAAPAAPLALLRPQDARARRLADAVLADLADDAPLARRARDAGLSPRTAARRFAEETGLGFAEWRQRARMLAAMARLADGASVTAAALDVGYGDVGAFIAAFRRLVGQTPGRFARDAPTPGYAASSTSASPEGSCSVSSVASSASSAGASAGKMPNRAATSGA